MAESLLTTEEVAALLRVHPKHVYRLLRRGLPGRKVGGEWRFLRQEVLDWSGGVAEEPAEVPRSDGPPPLLAANGDVAVEMLLARVNDRSRSVLGFVRSDRDGALRLLESGQILVAGFHGRLPPGRFGGVRLARIHLVRRAVGLAAMPSRCVPELPELARLQLAGRPATAGISGHLHRALAAAGLDPAALQVEAHSSHRNVACAVLRGEADVGLLTQAWAVHTGLAFRAIAVEPYGLVLRAADLGHPLVVRLCEAAQSRDYHAALRAIAGYDPTDAGDIRYDPE